MLVDYVSAHRNWSPRTVKIYVGEIRRFLRWCIRDGVLVVDVTRDFPMPKQIKREPDSFTEEEVAKILHEASRHEYLHAPIALALYAGLDPADFRALEWKDVDLDGKAITSRRAKTLQPIHVPIAPALDAILRQHRALSGPVCRGLPQSRSSFRKALNRLLVRAGVKEGGGWKKFRHTFGTLLGLQGVPLATIRRLMAHAPSSTVTLRYMHTDDRSAREAIERTFGNR